MECYCYLRNVEDLLADGKTRCERRFGESFNGPVIPFGATVEYHPISSRYQKRLHQFGEKVFLGIFLGHVLIARTLARTHCDCGHWGDEKPGLVRNPSSEAQCNRSVNATEGRETFGFQTADGTAKLFGRDHGVREPTSRREQLVKSEDLREELQGISERSPQAKDDAEAGKDFWSIEGDFIYRHHIEP